MPTKPELRDLARARLREAQALYDAGLYDGCAYLAGYVVELALKAVVCRNLDHEVYPDGDLRRKFRTHDYDTLLLLAGLQQKFDAAKSTNPALLSNWSVLANWSEQIRYEPVGTSAQAQAQDTLTALTDPSDGVLTWLKKRW